MQIRPFSPADLGALVALTIETFRPFYEESFPAMMEGDTAVIAHQHGNWQYDYHREVPTLHNPMEGRHVVVAVDDRIRGYVAWAPDTRPHLPAHGEITMLAVDAGSRGQGIGTALMEHAMDELRREGYRFVELGTGGDSFHAPARGLYESLDFHRIPVTAYLRSL